jgi:hypothetical protein
MSAYVVGYRPQKQGEIVQGKQLRPDDPPVTVVGYSNVPDSWVISALELAESECRILNGRQVSVGQHFCQFEVEKLDEDKFAIVCKSHPDTTSVTEKNATGNKA